MKNEVSIALGNTHKLVQEENCCMLISFVVFVALVAAASSYHPYLENTVSMYPVNLFHCLIWRMCQNLSVLSD